MTDIAVRTAGNVRIVTIDRTSRRNALTVDNAEQLREAIEAAGADERIGAIVLTGAGGHFCAGGDIDAISGVASSDRDDAPVRLMRVFHRLVEAVWGSQLPVVAAVSGVAYGGGFNLALACDLIVCSSDVRFCQVFLRRGLVPDIGGAYLVPRLIGMQRAKELMLLTPEVDAARAERMGLVNEVVPDAAAAGERALAVASELAAGPRLATALTKRLLNSSTDGSFAAALEQEAVTQVAMLRSQDTARNLHEMRARRSKT